MPIDLLEEQKREPVDLLADDFAPDSPIVSRDELDRISGATRDFSPGSENKIRDAVTIAATHNLPMSNALDLRDAYLTKANTSSLWDKATSSFKAGVGDVYSSLGGIMKRKGLDAGDIYADFGERLTRSYIPPADQSEFTWVKMTDPEWYATTVMRAVPFTLSLIPAAVVGMYAGGTVGGTVGLGMFGKTVLGAIGGAALSRPIESAFEAQGAYDEAKKKGFDDIDSEGAADKVFWDNMKLTGLDAAELATAFLPIGGKIAGKTAKLALGKRVTAATGIASAKVAGVGAMEMMEERYQEKAVMDATGDPVSLFDFDNPRLNEAGAAGFVFGAGMGGAGSVWTALKDRVMASPDDKTQFIFNKAKNDALAAGLSEREATVAALDAVAATPEGKAHIEKVMRDLVDLANGKPAQEQSAASAEKTGKPFIFGVQEDANGDVTGFTMADPITGQTFEVPALTTEEGEKARIIPDPDAVAKAMEQISQSNETEDRLNRIIEGQEDIDQAAAEILGEKDQTEDIDEMGFVDEEAVDLSGVETATEPSATGDVPAKNFIRTHDGKIDFGIIPDDIKEKSGGRYIGAPIRLEEGGEYGKEHISEKRIQEFKEYGYADEIQALFDITNNYQDIYAQPNGRILLVKRNGRGKFAVVELQDRGAYYGVTTWFLDDRKPNKKPYEKDGGRSLLLHVPRADNAGPLSPFPAPSAIDQSEGSRQSDQSSPNRNDNLAAETDKVKKDEGPTQGQVKVQDSENGMKIFEG